MDDAEIKELVRARYGAIAAAGASGAGCCAPAPASCCGPAEADKAKRMGYSEADLAAVPQGANLGLGCGNPQAITALRPGETVVDLGSGAGFDCFLAARAVGAGGRVIGIDMTPAMIEKARLNAGRLGAANVEFRLGELEHLPVADGAADVVISNCVINLVPDKARVFAEAFRILKRGGRLAVSDIVNLAPLPAAMQADLELLCACVSGAAPAERLAEWLTEAGFVDIRIAPRQESRALIETWQEGRNLAEHIAAATIEARKPDLGRPDEEQTRCQVEPR